ncbi:IS3 family transposase [Streptosporangium sp. NBC_01469]|uniref:IS3 family transposase n=1 Tax=Streptosporangium sp. NBC_01469 TaxID=2903898 RepID=UPI003FCDDF01
MTDLEPEPGDDVQVSSSKKPSGGGRPKRRTFTADYKLRILEEYDRLLADGEPGASGALLRREKLLTSHITEWRKARKNGALEALTPKVRKPSKSAAEVENEKLRAQNERLTKKLATTEAALEIMKSTRALGNALRERGFRHEATEVIDGAFTELEPLTSTKYACDITGKSRSTVHRSRNPRPGPPVARPRPAHPAKLSREEAHEVIETLNSRRFIDKAPAQVWAVLLDEGTYLCSISTMYRLLRAEGMTGDRRAQATHPAKVKPELVADGPGQVWSWDITKLKGPEKGVVYNLYVMIDIYSRYVVHWETWPAENAHLAKRFIKNAIERNGGSTPKTIHSDRGTPMTSKTVGQLLTDLKIDQSHSRPKVSNDNPYSEANFRTLKYCPAFPGRFGSIQDARQFCRRFFTYYNNEHRHSGIALHTPASVHHDTVGQVQTERARVLAAAYAANPERFRRMPTPPRLPERAWINQPEAKIETEQSAQNAAA